MGIPEYIFVISCVLVVVAIIVSAFYWCEYLPKKYNKILKNNPELQKQYDVYDKAYMEYDYILDEYVGAKDKVKELREKLPISLPEEKVEIYKNIKRSLLEIENLEILLDKFRENKNDCIRSMADLSKKLLSEKQSKFFIQWGEWSIND